MIAPAVFHPLLLMFPDDTWLNYIYLISVLLYHAGLY